MAETVTDEELLSILSGDDSSSVTDEQLLAIANQPVEEEPAPVFTSDQYVESPGFLQRLGITDIDTNNPIYQNLLLDPAFTRADPKEQRRMFIEAVDNTNQAIYEQQGEEVEASKAGQTVRDALSGQDDTQMRTQTSVDDEGRKQTYIVPSPASANIPKFAQTIAGGAVQAGKSIARLGEGITDALRITDPDTDYMRENFPTIPPRNDLDALGQEVTSMLMGSVGGVGLASKLEKAYNMSPKMARYVAKAWSKVGKKKPEEMIDAARIFAKTFILGTGANLGTTATTPQEAKPLFGDDIAELLGFDAQDNRNIANFADNVAFSTGLTVLGRLGGFAVRGGKAIFKGTSGLTKAGIDRDVGALVFKELDPNAANAPAEIFAERAAIFGDILRENNSTFFPLLGDTEIPRTSVDAVREGARKYVDRAYAWQKSLMEPEEFEKFADDLANSISMKMIDLHRSRLSSQAVRDADASVVEGMATAMNRTSDELGGQGAVANTAAELGAPIVDTVDAARIKADEAGAGLQAAEAALDQFSRNNQVIDLFQNAARNNQLGSNAVERKALQQLSGPQLYDAWRKSFTNYRNAWNNLPTDIELPVNEFYELTTSFMPPAEFRNFIQTITTTETAADPINRILAKMTPRVAEAPNGELVYETVEEMLARLEMQGVTMAEVFTDLRGQLDARAKYLFNNPMTKSQGAQLRRFVQGIDNIAKNVGDPSFQNALELYQKHDSTFDTIPLKNFEQYAKMALRKEGQTVGPDGLTPGMKDAFAKGNEAMKASMNDIDAYQKAFIAAIQSGGESNVTQEMSQAYLGMVMNGLAKNLEGGKAPNSAQIIGAMEEQLAKLENLDPSVVERFRTVVGELRNLEAGLTDAKTVADNMRNEYNVILADAKRDAAAKFVDDLVPGATPQITQEPQAAFDKIFGATTGQGNTLDKLMAEAAKRPDGDLIIAGLQASYLQFIKNKVFIARKIALESGNTTGAVNDVSGYQIQEILNNPSNPVRNGLNIVFKNNPGRKDQFLRLLELQDVSTASRSIRGEAFGSTTTYDQDLTKLVDRLITLRYGVLNTRATIARNISKALLKPSVDDIQRTAQEAMDILVAKPDEFDRMLRLTANGNDKEAMNLFGRLASTVVDQTPLALRGAYLAQESVDEQTQEALPQ